jgi:glycosyltransferase involved in cell wall biosynthesis
VADVGALLAATDVLALPYRLTIGQNAYPNVMLEAFSLGVPLVTTRLPLLEEVVTEGETALLSAPSDPRSLATAINQLLDDTALRGRMRERQQRFARRAFDPTAIARRLDKVYQGAIHGQARLLRPAARRQQV